MSVRDLYRQGLATSRPRESMVMAGMFDMAEGLSRGRDRTSLYRIGLHGGDPVVGDLGVKAWFEETILDIVHLMLLVGGVVLVARGIMA